MALLLVPPLLLTIFFDPFHLLEFVFAYTNARFDCFRIGIRLDCSFLEPSIECLRSDWREAWANFHPQSRIC